MNALLDVQDIHKSFGGVKAVQGVSFQLHEGEILGLIGPNGSGKSTCVNMISGLYSMDSGKVFFGGHEFTPKITIPKRAHMGIGRTFQTPRPFGTMSVYNNIFSVALQTRSFAEAKDKTEQVLEITRLADSRDMMSEKLPIEMRKWMDFARVLALDPKAVMMDECLGGLNNTEIEEFVELIAKINQNTGIAILFIEHIVKAVASLCPRIVVLNEGMVLAEGAPNDVLRDPAVVTAYIGE